METLYVQCFPFFGQVNGNLSLDTLCPSISMLHSITGIECSIIDRPRILHSITGMECNGWGGVGRVSDGAVTPMIT